MIAADPDAARRRKEKAGKRARVERWAEDAGTAALAGRDLPPAGVLAADAHLTGWAHRLKAAGLPGTLDQLRAQVYLALLNGQPPETLLPAGTGDEGHPTVAAAEGRPASGRSHTEPTGAHSPGGPAGARSHTEPTAGHGPGGPAGAAAGGEPARTGACGEDLSRSGNPGTTAGRGAAATAAAPAPGQPPAAESERPPGPWPGRAPDPAGPPVRGSVHLVLPLLTWLGWSATPGEAAGFGPLDATDSRALAAALARDPATQWCLTVTGPDGRAVAHGCAKTGPGHPPPAPAAQAWAPARCRHQNLPGQARTLARRHQKLLPPARAPDRRHQNLPASPKASARRQRNLPAPARAPARRPRSLPAPARAPARRPRRPNPPARTGAASRRPRQRCLPGRAATPAAGQSAPPRTAPPWTACLQRCAPGCPASNWPGSKPGSAATGGNRPATGHRAP